MSQNNEQPLSRLEELTADRALFGLSIEEAEELQLLCPEDDWTADSSNAMTAALLHEALLGDAHLQEMPASLKDSIAQSARFQVRPAADTPPAREPRSSENWMQPIGAAAAILLAIIGIFAFVNSAKPEVGTELLSAAFEKSTQDVTKSNWKTVLDGFADVSGYVSWSGNKQDGFMHLKGLPQNDPSQSQYQLWIVDGDRTGAPVDGGVFDVDSNGEVVIPIESKLRVSNAKAFVITKERPGGVVVSKGPHLVIAAF